MSGPDSVLGGIYPTVCFAIPSYFPQIPSGHSGLVLTLSNAARPPCPAPTCYWRIQASALLLHWKLPLGTQSVGFNYLFFLLVMLPSVVPRLATDLAVRVFPGVLKPLFFKTPFPGWSSVPTSFVSLYLLYFSLPPFEDNGLLFWVADVLW